MGWVMNSDLGLLFEIRTTFLGLDYGLYNYILHFFIFFFKKQYQISLALNN